MLSEYTNIVSKIKNLFLQEEFGAKTILVAEGKIAQKAYYIEKGAARAWFNHDGKEITFQFLFEGEFISSIESILSKSPSWYSIETIEPLTVYSISTEEFRQKMEQLPHVKEFYNHYIQQRLQAYQKLFVSHIKDSPEKRYQELLQQSPEIIRRIPQHYIASYLGITSVSLSRIRNRR
jgi:CRP-like cAMP-binding protein